MRRDTSFASTHVAPFLLALAALAAPLDLRAQPTAEPPNRPTRICAELLGNAGAGSLNLERQVTQRFAVRAGVGYMPGIVTTTTSTYAAPVMLSFTPKGSRGVEAGLGWVFRYRTRCRRTTLVRGTCVEGVSMVNDTFRTATVGYRWITTKGAIYRVGLTPIFGNAEGNQDARGWLPLVGVSVGGAF